MRNPKNTLKFLKDKIKKGDFEKAENPKLDAYRSVVNHCRASDSEHLDLILKKESIDIETRNISHYELSTFKKPIDSESPEAVDKGFGVPSLGIPESIDSKHMKQIDSKRRSKILLGEQKILREPSSRRGS